MGQDLRSTQKRSVMQNSARLWLTCSRCFSQGQVPEQAQLCLDSCSMSQNRERGLLITTLKGLLWWNRVQSQSSEYFWLFLHRLPCDGSLELKPGDRQWECIACTFFRKMCASISHLPCLSWMNLFSLSLLLLVCLEAPLVPFHQGDEFWHVGSLCANCTNYVFE